VPEHCLDQVRFLVQGQFEDGYGIGLLGTGCQHAWNGSNEVCSFNEQGQGEEAVGDGRNVAFETELFEDPTACGKLAKLSKVKLLCSRMALSAETIATKLSRNSCLVEPGMPYPAGAMSRSIRENSDTSPLMELVGTNSTETLGASSCRIRLSGPTSRVAA
jgi:hypothetical protein